MFIQFRNEIMAGGNISLFHQKNGQQERSWLYLVLQMLFLLYTFLRIILFSLKVENCSWFVLLYSMIGYDNYFPCTIEVCFGIYIGLDNRISNKHFFK